MNTDTFLTFTEADSLISLSSLEFLVSAGHSEIYTYEGVLNGRICKMALKSVPNTEFFAKRGSREELECEIEVTTELSKKIVNAGVQPAPTISSVSEGILLRPFYQGSYYDALKLPLKDRIPLAKTMLQSLYTIGVNHLFHLDIREDNFSHDGSRFVMLDFGNAMFLDQQGPFKEFLEDLEECCVATPRCHPYAEVIRAHGQLMKLIDSPNPSPASPRYQKFLDAAFRIQCFAVGVCLYRLLSRELPYPQIECATLDDYFDAHEDSSYTTSDLSKRAKPLVLSEERSFGHFVTRMIDRVPTHRPTLEEVSRLC